MPSTGGALRILPPVAVPPLLLALPVIAASLTLPWQGQWVCAVVLIIALGVPHGALDVEIGRTLLRHRVGWAWFPLFAVPYLVLVAIVLVAWRLAPEFTLAGFLLLSVWHFGTEETGSGGLPALALGGLPVALPVLLHPSATAAVLSAISAVPFSSPPNWLMWASLLWLPLMVAWVIRTMFRGLVRPLVVPLFVGAGFAALSPIVAFTLYFVVVHASAHTAALISHPTRAPRVRGPASAWWRALPTTILTVLIGAALWFITPGEPAIRLVCTTLQLLAGLTLPHMLLDAWLTARDNAPSRTLARSGPLRA